MIKKDATTKEMNKWIESYFPEEEKKLINFFRFVLFRSVFVPLVFPTVFSCSVQVVPFQRHHMHWQIKLSMVNESNYHHRELLLALYSIGFIGCFASAFFACLKIEFEQRTN